MVTIGCVSYLNARPLTDGLENEPAVNILSDVPSRLLGRLLRGEVDIALCPIIDYQTSPTELCIVPAGAIGSEGPALTVRLFSERPLSEVRRVAVDRDSRTSVALLQVVLGDLYGVAPQLQPLPDGRPPQRLPAGVDAILLIGDKVVTAAPHSPTSSTSARCGTGSPACSSCSPLGWRRPPPSSGSSRTC